MSSSANCDGDRDRNGGEEGINVIGDKKMATSNDKKEASEYARDFLRKAMKVLTSHKTLIIRP